MTTVAYVNGVMAADEVATCSDELSFGVEKVGRTENYLFGYAGRFSALRPLYKWIESLDKEGVHPQDFYLHRDSLACDDEGHAIIADRSGRVWEVESDGHVFQVSAGCAAIGSGNKYAKGAIAYGASAKKAVKIATSFDAFTAGKVSVWSFDMPVHCPNEMEDK